MSNEITTNNLLVLKLNLSRKIMSIQNDVDVIVNALENTLKATIKENEGLRSNEDE